MTAPDRGTQPGTAQPGTGRQPGRGTSGGALTLLLTSAASFMVILDALVVVTALPAIHHDLGGGISTLQWTVSAYTIAFGAGILTAAALGDRLGRRRVYVAGLALFTAASAACALAPTSTTLITFRAFQGLGAIVIGVQLEVRVVEEPYLRRVHGDAYEQYTTSVGRFLPRIGRR